MKRFTLIIFFIITCFGYSQQTEGQRILAIKNQLEALSVGNAGLTENVKSEVNVSNITLANFLSAIADLHKVNINASDELKQISISPNFPDVTVANLLVFLCKEYNLTIDFTGNILAVKPYEKPQEQPKERIIPITYNPSNNTISIDARGDKLSDVVRRIIDETGKNLVYSSGLDNNPITIYIQALPFDVAMDKLGFANNLFIEQSKNGIYVIESNLEPIVNNSGNPNANQQAGQRPIRRRSSNFFFKVLDKDNRTLEVDFANTPISNIINDIATELDLDVFTATPLDQAGNATFKARNISFDNLLVKLFEINSVGNSSSAARNGAQAQGNAQTSRGLFTFKKEGDIYFFGKDNQLSVREVAIIQLQHRSVELLSDPSGGFGNRRVGRNNFNNFNSGFNNTGFNNNFNNNQFNTSNTRREQLNTSNSGNFNNYSNKAEALVNILPDELKNNLDIKVDTELNSFYVNGPSASIERFKKFISKIDKPVPVVLIEVMIIEVSRTSDVETGVSWGIGDEPTETSGAIFPEADITLGANTINKVIGGFDGFGSFNLGKVVPNFFASIKAMETNGDLKVRSTPKLSTLNGHRATFSNGQTSYYAITQQSIIGADNPVTQTAVNYAPIDAELGLTIKPFVSGDGQVTLDISVIQSTFGARIADDAPPDISSREFSSLIRMRDQDIAVLGGLEEQMKSNSGSGVPFLARIPIIKYLFSKRRREAKKAKLTVLIKPTVIY